MATREKKGGGKKDGKGKAPAKTAPADDVDEAGAAQRVALLRRKLTRAMEDPLMRDQIVRAIRDVMKEN